MDALEFINMYTFFRCLEFSIIKKIQIAVKFIFHLLFQTTESKFLCQVYKDS